MFKVTNKVLCIGLLLCVCFFAQASDVIEILGFHVPIESQHANIQVACANNDKFIKSECFYGAETHRLEKMVVTSPQVGEAELEQGRQRILSWVSENLIPDAEGGAVCTDYAESWTSNSWGEVAFVKAHGNRCSVTLERIAIAERLNKSGHSHVRFPDDFMGFDLSPRLTQTNLVRATVSVFEGANKGRYAYCVWEVPHSSNKQSFFNSVSCELSLKTKSILAVRLKKRFCAQDRVSVLDECRKIMCERYDVGGMRNITNPITGDVIGGTFGVDDSGICANFKIVQSGLSTELLLTVDFQLPHSAYGELLSEGVNECGYRR